MSEDKKEAKPKTTIIRKYILPAQAKGLKQRSSLTYGGRMAATVARNRSWTPLCSTGFHFVANLIIQPHEYGKLDVDPIYQRGRTTSVPEILAALQSGGKVTDPVCLAQRPWQPESKGKYFIVDGFQRACALQECNMPIEAKLYSSDSIEDECIEFIIRNNRRLLTNNIQVKAWRGPVNDLLTCLNGKKDCPAWGRLDFMHSGGDKLSSATLARGIDRLLNGARVNMDIRKILSRCDNALTTNSAKVKATYYVYLIATIFPKYARLLPSMAFAEVARKRWEKFDGPVPPFPSKGAITRLSKINWATALPGESGSYQDYANSIIERYWKE